MADDTAPLGRIQRTENDIEGRIERHFPHPPEALWQMLTEPQAIAQWLAPGTIDLRLGGRVHIDFGDSGVVIDSTVLALEPLQELSYSWSNGDDPERPLRWRLARTETGTDLVLTVTLPAAEDIAKACAGFEAHLEMLAAALEGVPIHFPFQLYLARRGAYQEMLTE